MRISSELSFEDDIQMVNIEDQLEHSGTKLPAYTSRGDSDEEDSREGDEEALLGPQERTRGPERVAGPPAKLWPQIQGIVIETAPTLMLTTISLLFTGELLDHVSRWPAMKQVDQLIMIIPVILNLKGNLEMNLSARLGTAAGLGELDKPKTRRAIVLGNLSLLQLQATVVSFVAACVSVILGLVVPQTMASQAEPSSNSTLPAPSNATMLAFHRLASVISVHPRRPRPTLPSDSIRKTGFPEIVMVASTAMCAACLSSLLLGSFMCFLVVMCRKFGRDPDNIAPAIASCLGDLVTLTLLGLVSSVLIKVITTPIPLILIVLVVVSAIICGVLTTRNPYVKELLKEGWSPLFGAMFISTGTGIVLDMYVNRYEGYALLAVVISGLPGSVGAILVSRLSTALHAAALALSGHASSSTAPSPRTVMVTLFVVTLPIELVFVATLRSLGWLHLPLIFIAFSMLSFCSAVIASLLIAQKLTDFLWSKGLDPDMYALPVHSAFMDLVGQLLLVLCYEIASAAGMNVRANAPGL